MRKVFLLFVAAGLLLTGGIDARAQVEGTARTVLYSLQTDGFPTMTAGLDVFDSAGNFVTGLTPEAITLLEDDQTRPASGLEQLSLGVQFALALDPGPTFSYRDVYAVSRYDKVESVLLDWAATHSDEVGDDLSFVPTAGEPSTHLATGAAFAEALKAYSPVLQSTVQDLNTLSNALDAVSEAAVQEGMKRVVLFVTSPPQAEDIPALQSLTQRAVTQGVRVHVWIVASADYSSTAGATALKDLAIQSGGQYVLFSGEEPLPGPETYLAPLRYTCRLTYTSGVSASGSHTLSAQVDLNGEAVAAQAVTFELDLQPPNPILLAPPEQITRQAPDKKTRDIAAFLPAQQQIDIIVEFPDGHPRPLIRTTLYVDNQPVAENIAEPFDRFLWDLSGYTVSGQHSLQVEAEDSLGFSKISLGVPVTLTVIRPQTGILAFLANNSMEVVLGAILFAGLILGIILGRGQRRRGLQPPGRKSKTDPLTQPVPTEPKKQAPRSRWARPAKPAGAYLVRLKEGNELGAVASIPVVGPEMTLGSDPLQVTRVLNHPSVSPLHARIRQEDGGYTLLDEKSTAGTWVNYEPLKAPHRLQHGDILHFGRLAYRFELQRPPERSGPKITPLKK